jgi:hypothetical protein
MIKNLPAWWGVGALTALGLAACSPIEGGVDGGLAKDPNFAEAHCQQFGEHSAIQGMVSSDEKVSFRCHPAEDRPTTSWAETPAEAERRCQADRGKHASIGSAGKGITYVQYSCFNDFAESSRPHLK